MFDSSSARLLLIEKEPVLRELTTFRLQLLGYQIHVVESGAEAMVEIGRDAPNLVIVNTTLADGDGIEWIARMRSEYTAEQVPVLVFSLDPSLETVERAFHSGAQDYLITPFDPTVMEEKIEALLTGQHAATK